MLKSKNWFKTSKWKLLVTIQTMLCFFARFLYFYFHFHTRHFATQYCDIAIKRYCDKKIISSHMFQWPTKVSSEKTYLDFFKELTLAFRDPWPKNVFLSQYCVRKCLVWIRPKQFFYLRVKENEWSYRPKKWEKEVIFVKNIIFKLSFPQTTIFYQKS